MVISCHILSELLHATIINKVKTVSMIFSKFQPKMSIYFFPCLPLKLRFGEWSQACAQLQLDELLGNNKALAITYLCICLSDDPNMRSLSSTIAGQFMAKWWDVSAEAGPKRRPRTAFNESIPTLNILSAANGVCKTLDSCFAC